MAFSCSEPSITGNSHVSPFRISCAVSLICDAIWLKFSQFSALKGLLSAANIGHSRWFCTAANSATYWKL